MQNNPLKLSAADIAHFNEHALRIMEETGKVQVHEDMVFCAPINPQQVQVTEEL